jgi:hypothetical protein
MTRTDLLSMQWFWVWSVCLAASLWLPSVTASPLFASPPSVQTPARKELIHAGTVLLADLRLLRKTAVEEGNPYRVSLVGQGQYKIHRDDNGDGIENSGELTITRDLAALYPGVTLGGSAFVTLFPDNICGMPGAITVANRVGRIRIDVQGDGEVIIR